MCGCGCGSIFGSGQDSGGSTREVIREVVVIPCKYCGTLFAQTATFCPHCGARRTA